MKMLKNNNFSLNYKNTRKIFLSLPNNLLYSLKSLKKMKIKMDTLISYMPWLIADQQTTS